MIYLYSLLKNKIKIENKIDDNENISSIYNLLFILSRLLFLKLLLKKNVDLTPKDFLMYQLNSNSLIVKSIFENITEKFEKEINNSNFISCITNVIKRIIKEIKQITNFKLGIALDECQNLAKKFLNCFYSSMDANNKQNKRRSFLTLFKKCMYTFYEEFNFFFFSGTLLNNDIKEQIFSDLLKYDEKNTIADTKFKIFSEFENFYETISKLILLDNECKKFLKDNFKYYFKGNYKKK
jgi:hypothetical protein